MRKSIKSVMAFALAASMIASTVAPAATVSAASKVNVITKATYNSGSTVKYSYNKKGLITKSVSTSSSKDNDSDTSTTVTTTFKYNKKNKISSKTSKTVEKVTSYETDKTTGLKLGAKKGTVTTTTTAVTAYTYNKKGLATQSVTTTTEGKTGSVTSTDKSTFITDDESDRRELSDGRILAGYNYYKADGTKNDENTVANAYYYEGSAATTEGVSTTTTTYTDNGNGTYTKTSTTTRTSAGYKTEPVRTYYAVIGKYVNGVDTETVIPVKYSEDGFEGEREESHYDSDKEENVTSKVKYTYYYQTADGKDLNYAFTDGSWVKNTFSITEKVVITADPTVTSTSTSTNTTVNVGKSVTTTKYTYDKKKRVKKAVATTVNTGETTTNSSYSGNSTGNRKYGKTESKTESKTEYTDKSKSTNDSTNTSTTTYTYDKKGRAKKVVTSEDGISNYTNTNTGGFNHDDYYGNTASHSTYNYESTSTDSDGKKTTVSYSYNYGDAYPTTTTYASVGGTQTTTTTYNPYKFTYNYSRIDENGTTTKALTDDVTRYGNGGEKTVQTYTNTYAYTNNNDSSRTETGTRTDYSFDKYNKSNGYSYTGKTTYTSGTFAPSESSGAYYIDGKDSSSGVAAMTKIDAAKTALEATGTVYNDTETKTALATPSKNTTTYAYDKKGNVKSAKSSGTSTEIKSVKNETYGNTIYEFDAAGKLQEKEVAVTHKNTDKDAMENTVKKGTKVLTKQLTANKYTYDRVSDSSSYLSRVLFTIKGKKSSTAKLVNKQQWIIQNGTLNGVVGLD